MSHKPTKIQTLFNSSVKTIAFTSLLIASSSIQAQLQTVKQKASYAIGVNFAKSIQMQGVELDADSVTQGIKDALTGKKTALTIADMQKALDAYKAQIIAEQEKLQGAQAGKNKQQGEAFLAANKNKPGVVTLNSGLQYKVLKSGNGPSPKLTDKVTTHYRGTLIDGTEFDSSYSRNEPTSFPVKGVIPGWTEALQLMKEGDKWQLFIPANLAYGNRSVGKVIQPNSTLIFEIELLKVN